MIYYVRLVSGIQQRNYLVFKLYYFKKYCGILPIQKAQVIVQSAYCEAVTTFLFAINDELLPQIFSHIVPKNKSQSDLIFFFRRKVIRKQVSVLATRLTYICVYLELYPTGIVALPLKYKKQTHSLRYTVFLKCVWHGAEQREMLTQLFT